jgi:PHD/YefM family antitoxin component YafN of YafNO toxin-antitoxin module
MIIDSSRMIPVTRLQKELPARIREVSAEDSPLFVLKNNHMEAVIVSATEYERLKDALDIVEHFEIGDMINKRMKKYDRSTNISWDELKKK